MDEEVERHRETVFESIGNCSVYLSRQWETDWCMYVFPCVCVSVCLGVGGGVSVYVRIYSYCLLCHIFMVKCYT